METRYEQEHRLMERGIIATHHGFDKPNKNL